MSAWINYSLSGVVFVYVLFVGSLHGNDRKNLKILHMSFHQGCIDDIQEVARELSLDITPWYILSSDVPREHFDGVTVGNGVYNLTHERAEAIWKKHKDYFDQFDVVITSDTAPLSRIFLQNGWTKPLIIWVCNRLDYYDAESLDGVFPDEEYYDLIRKATKQDNIQIISYTLYEYVYAASKGIDIGTSTVKPLGSKEKELVESTIPQDIDKKTTIFTYPRLDEKQLQYVTKQCERLGIPTYSGSYNGPEDIKDFKGVLYFPYAWSNLALFENLQRGIVHFVPSESFVYQERDNVRFVTLNQFSLVEWYMPEHRDLMVYFDSWEDLKHKIETTDYAFISQKAKIFARIHREAMVALWISIFDKAYQYKKETGIFITNAASSVFSLFS